MKCGEDREAEGRREPETLGPVALSFPCGVEEMALQKVSGLVFGVSRDHPQGE